MSTRISNSLEELAECNDRILAALLGDDVNQAADLIRTREPLIQQVSHERIEPSANLPLLKRLREQGDEIDSVLRRRAGDLEQALQAANTVRAASAGYSQASIPARSILKDGLTA